MDLTYLVTSASRTLDGDNAVSTYKFQPTEDGVGGTFELTLIEDDASFLVGQTVTMTLSVTTKSKAKK